MGTINCVTIKVHGVHQLFGTVILQNIFSFQQKKEIQMGLEQLEGE